MRKRTALVAVPVALLAAGGVAWAALGGVVYLPDVVQGIATGNGGNSCQTSALSFTVPTPTWSNSLQDYAVSTVDYSGVTQICQNQATADLELRLVVNNSTVATASAANLQTVGGTLTLSQEVTYDAATSADFVYLVVG
mgnify:CR=1 FL=1